MHSIGFIGVGVMGKSMVRNLQKGGFSLHIYTRSKGKVQDLIDEGVEWHDDAASCAAGRDAVITMLGFPQDVEEVYFGAGGLLEGAQEGCYVIDMTTTDPSLSLRIYNAAKEKGIKALDAPVSGGDAGAKNATLSIMVGGDREDFKACMPIFAAMGENIVYQGTAGAGQHCKMANQIALSGVIACVCEALGYGKKAGLDMETMLESIAKGAAGSWQMDNNAPRILAGDMEPGFFIKHYVKDLTIASQQAAAMGARLDTTETVLGEYKKLVEEGYGDLGTQALIKYYEEE